jgi:hypothetical protein
LLRLWIFTKGQSMSHTELQAVAQILGHDLPSMDRALSRSLVDAAYRKRLLQDAKAAFKEEGVVFPEEVAATCHEISLADRHFFLPAMVSDPAPVPEEKQAPTARNRPKTSPDVPPVAGGVRHGVARPFLLGHNYPAPPSGRDEPEGRW